jgi:hypothetical protein
MEDDDSSTLSEFLQDEQDTPLPEIANPDPDFPPMPENKDIPRNANLLEHTPLLPSPDPDYPPLPKNKDIPRNANLLQYPPLPNSPPLPPSNLQDEPPMEDDDSLPPPVTSMEYNASPVYPPLPPSSAEYTSSLAPTSSRKTSSRKTFSRKTSSRKTLPPWGTSSRSTLGSRKNPSSSTSYPLVTENKVGKLSNARINKILRDFTKLNKSDILKRANRKKTFDKTMIEVLKYKYGNELTPKEHLLLSQLRDGTPGNNAWSNKVGELIEKLRNKSLQE